MSERRFAYIGRLLAVWLLAGAVLGVVLGATVGALVGLIIALGYIDAIRWRVVVRWRASSDKSASRLTRRPAPRQQVRTRKDPKAYRSVARSPVRQADLR